MTNRRTKTSARTLAVATAAFFLATLGFPRASEAQQAELTAHTGVLTPTSDLLSGETTGTEGSSLGTGVPFGATLGVRFETGIGVEASGIRAFDVAVEGDAILSESAEFSALTSHLTYTVPMGESPVVSPLFGVGLGVRNIDYAEVTAGEPVVDDASDFAGVGLAGLVFAPDSWIGARAEGRLYLSSYEAFDEANGQQDIAFLAGITIRTPE